MNGESPSIHFELFDLAWSLLTLTVMRAQIGSPGSICSIVISSVLWETCNVNVWQRVRFVYYYYYNKVEAYNLNVQLVLLAI